MLGSRSHFPKDPTTNTPLSKKCSDSVPESVLPQPSWGGAHGTYAYYLWNEGIASDLIPARCKRRCLLVAGRRVGIPHRHPKGTRGRYLKLSNT